MRARDDTFRWHLHDARKNPKLYAALAIRSTEELRTIHARCWRLLSLLGAPGHHERRASLKRAWSYQQWRVTRALLDAAMAAHTITLLRVSEARDAQFHGQPEYLTSTYAPSYLALEEVAS